MTQRSWIIEGWEGTSLLWSKKVPYGCLTDGQMEQVLKCLCAKHGLTNEEIVSSFAKRNTKMYMPHLEIQRAHKKPFYISCGNNPYFVARIDSE